MTHDFLVGCQFCNGPDLNQNTFGSNCTSYRPAICHPLSAVNKTSVYGGAARLAAVYTPHCLRHYK